MGPKYQYIENQVKQNAYTLVNIKTGYRTSAWEAFIYGRNILDEKYMVRNFSSAVRYGEPVIIGAQFNIYF
jgi:outer membrane receptor protein involved in Fe transport